MTTSQSYQAAKELQSKFWDIKYDFDSETAQVQIICDMLFDVAFYKQQGGRKEVEPFLDTALAFCALNAEMHISKDFRSLCGFIHDERYNFVMSELVDMTRPQT